MEPLILPTYGRDCVTEVMPSLLGKTNGDALPASFAADGPRLLFVLDGLGWDQLQQHREIAPTLSRMTGGPITTVAPSDDRRGTHVDHNRAGPLRARHHRLPDGR